MDLTNAVLVLNKLHENGFEAYMVGGFVRDHYLGFHSNDIDITTNATPEEVMKLFKSVPIGLKFGTVLVLMGSDKFEVTTYRCDEEYIDGRHPIGVKYSKVLIEDLKRRDFSMNALCMDENLKIYDYVDGIKDIEAKLIRSIGDPIKRFNEDALRILRAFSFVSKLGFSIENKTKEAICILKDNLAKISYERIIQEIKKICQGNYSLVALNQMKELGICLYGLEEGIDYCVKINFKPNYLELFGITSILNGKINDFWRFSKKEAKMLEDATKMVKNKVKFDLYDIFIYGLDESILAYSISKCFGFNNEKDIKKMFNDLPIKSIHDLAIDGNIMIKLGFEGKEIKEKLDEISYNVISGKINNNYEEIKDFVLKGR